MADRLDAEQRSANMRAIRSKGMKPEMIVRQLVHSMGYRYRLHRKDLPGKPDLVFGPRRKVIFVHGCFWHQHGDPACKLAHAPKSRLDYWQPKLSRNQERDAAHQAELESRGWKVLTIWECETRQKCRQDLAARLDGFLRPD
jgi:DNA mismatch endonuclease (patch repair protein)